MKIKEGIIIQKIDDEYILIDSGIKEPAFNGMVKLNETSKEMVELLQKEDLTVEQIVSKLMDIYEGDKKEITQSVEHFISELSKTPLLIK